MIDPVVSVSFRCALAALFAAAAWHKTSDLPRFRATLLDYRLLPLSVGRAFAALVPGMEIAIATALLLPAYRWAAYAGLTLLVVYTVAMAVNLARGRREIDCGCLGPASRSPLRGGLLVRNTILMAGAVGVAMPLRERSLVWLDAFTVAVVVAVTALLWTSFWRLRVLHYAEESAR
ncbi:MAG: MauE/DoxX family redox-associated membrane protein [Myxococcota bacterium]